MIASATGEIRKLIIIGHAAKPRSFRNINPKHLPVDWYSNKKAWMTGTLFKEILHRFNSQMKAENRHIILLMDNASSHLKGLQLSHIKVIFLPANTTSVIQPLDQGIIMCMKRHYKKLLMNYVISQIDMDNLTTGSDIAKSVTPFMAIKWLSSAAKQVKKSTVIKCFDKCGVPTTATDEDDPEDDIPLASLIRNISSKLGLSKPLSEDEFLAIDDEAETHEDFSEAWDQPSPEAEDGPECEIEDVDLPTSEPEKVPTLKEALKAACLIEQYCLHRNLADALQSISSTITSLEEAASNSSMMKQTSITNYFSNKQ